MPVITADQAPVVARVPHTAWNKDFHDRTVYEDIRAWNGGLWSPYLNGESSKDNPPVQAGSPAFPAEVDKTGWHYSREQADAEDAATSMLRGRVIIDGIVHRRREEPVYYIRTFGMGLNHGGTSLFVGSRSDDPDGPLAARTWPVTAREAAVEAAVQVAHYSEATPRAPGPFPSVHRRSRSSIPPTSPSRPLRRPSRRSGPRPRRSPARPRP